MKITITLSGGWGNPDPRMIYKVNRHGHHGSNFVHNPDILALGCSVTAGCGLPYDLTWPHLVARELDQTVNVISHPGASIQRIFNNFICYAKEFGLPKKILFLTPDLGRLWFPEIKKENLMSSFDWDSFDNNFMFTENKKQKPLIYKDYFNINRSLPLEAAVFSAFTSLNYLEFFHNLGIEYNFFSWDGETNHIYNKMDNDFYISSGDEESNLRYLTEHERCLDHHCLDEEHSFFWNAANDYGYHPGMHSHVHYAERFLGKSLSEKTIKDSKVTKKP
jgi:hypothetical protein